MSISNSVVIPQTGYSSPSCVHGEEPEAYKTHRAREDKKLERYVLKRDLRANDAAWSFAAGDGWRSDSAERCFAWAADN